MFVLQWNKIMWNLTLSESYFRRKRRRNWRLIVVVDVVDIIPWNKNEINNGALKVIIWQTLKKNIIEAPDRLRLKLYLLKGRCKQLKYFHQAVSRQMYLSNVCLRTFTSGKWITCWCLMCSAIYKVWGYGRHFNKFSVNLPLVKLRQNLAQQLKTIPMMSIFIVAAQKI
jgi:hypothetical protein